MLNSVHYYIHLAFGNKNKIKKSKNCGCYYCCSLFNNKDVKSFLKERYGKETALCPNCGIDSVIDEVSIIESGENLTIDLLKEINKEAF